MVSLLMWRWRNLPDSHAFLDICGRHLVPKAHHELHGNAMLSASRAAACYEGVQEDSGTHLGYLLDVDHVFGCVSAGVHDFGAPCHLHATLSAMHSCVQLYAVVGCLPWLGKLSCPPFPVLEHRAVRRWSLRTWSGCSSCCICLSDTRSQRLGAASPVSDSLIPQASWTRFVISLMSFDTLSIREAYGPSP